MTKLEEIISISTIEEAVKFLIEFNKGSVLEDIYICAECKDNEIKGCYKKEICDPKIIRKYLME